MLWILTWENNVCNLFDYYSQTPRYGHLLYTGTSLLRTVCFVPGKRNSFNPLYTDTPLTRTLSMAPSVSILTGFIVVLVFPCIHHNYCAITFIVGLFLWDYFPASSSFHSRCHLVIFVPFPVLVPILATITNFWSQDTKILKKLQNRARGRFQQN